MTFNSHRRHTKEHNFIIGDHVLLKQKKTNKWSTVYEPAFYIITRVDGSSIAARSRGGSRGYREYLMIRSDLSKRVCMDLKKNF